MRIPMEITTTTAALAALFALSSCAAPVMNEEEATDPALELEVESEAQALQAACGPQDPDCRLQNPCAVTLCRRGTQCVVVPGHPPRAECVPIDRCSRVRCRAGTHCEDGTCVPDEPKVFCGGIAGIPCPGAGQCIDDPSDNCDPRNGGADCGGMCVCNVIGLCLPPGQWSSSPEVCGCEYLQ